MTTSVSYLDSLSGKHLCVQWPTLGPYHIARLDRAAKLFSRHSIELTALELSSTDLAGMTATRTTDSSAFKRRTLLESVDARKLSPRVADRMVTQALDDLNPDAVAINSYSTPDARAALAWCIVNGRASILMTDSRHQDANRIRWREKLKSLLILKFGSALVAGKPQKEYLESFGLPSSYIFTGYDVVDNDYFAGMVDRHRSNSRSSYELPGLADDRPFFLAVGRIIPRKDIDTLIEGYRRYLQRTEAPWRLIIVGGGSDLPKITRRIDEIGIKDVTLAGEQPFDAIPVYYAFAGAFVHAARVDQWGLVVNEAMASGLPVIVSDGTGSAGELVVENETGFQFPAGDASRLAELMDRIASDAPLRRKMSSSARSHIANWSLDGFAESLALSMRAAMSRTTPKRRLDAAIVAIRVLRLIAPRMTTFHSVEA